MSDKKESGVRMDIGPAEFKKGLRPPTEGMKARKAGNFLLKILDFFGIVNTSSLKPSGHRGASSASQEFRASHHVDTPPSAPRTPTHEEWVVNDMAQRAYMDMVDGRGDGCGCDHDER